MLIVVGFGGIAIANKSVFVISKHSTPSSAQAFAIDENGVI